MGKGKSDTSGLTERRRERETGKRTGGRQMTATSARKVSGAVDPIGFLCDVLSNESAPDHEREEAAEGLLPHYHPKLAKMGPLLRRFLLGPLLRRCLCDQRP
jgi:hypothetical protein